MNIDGRYVSFKEKLDNSNEIISAEHINTLQDVSERTQQGVFKSQDRDFLDKALFVLEHHRFLNAMWIDLFEDTTKVNVRGSTGVQFSETEQGIVLLDQYNTGEVISTIYRTPNTTQVNDILLIANGYTPIGSSIRIFFSNNNVNWTPIVSGSDATIKIPFEGNMIVLKAVLERVDFSTDSPRLDAWAILYKDEKNDLIELPDGSLINPNEGGGDGSGGFGSIVELMHSQLMGVGPDDHHAQSHSHDGTDGSGLVSHSSLIHIGEDDHHSKDHQHGVDGVSLIDLSTDVKGSLPLDNLSYKLWTGKPGSTGLHFDPTIGDKLVYVKSPDDETYMFYDMAEDRLSHTITIVQGIAVWEKLFFGPYEASTGEVNIVLSGTEKTHYDANDEMILKEIAKITAPSQVVGLTFGTTGFSGELIAKWTKSPELDVVGYRVHVSEDQGNSWTVMNNGAVIAENSYVLSGLIDGKEYMVKVEAVDETGYISDMSISVSGIPTPMDIIPPSAVENASVEILTPTSVQIKWDINSDVDFDRYEIIMSGTAASSSWATLKTIKDREENQCYIDSLSKGQEYFFRILSVDQANNKTPSAILNIIM